MVELRIALLHSGMTQLELAKKCGLSRNVVNAIFRELRSARPEERAALARVLGRKESQLFPDAAAEGKKRK